ncbi:MAG: hypothetical protein LBD14_07020 [Puniceicoccales bacterium]|jgi:hypothetical protein|nr:hypothetical protein [Puniceicoccales bacterium]
MRNRAQIIQQLELAKAELKALGTSLGLKSTAGIATGIISKLMRQTNNHEVMDAEEFEHDVGDFLRLCKEFGKVLRKLDGAYADGDLGQAAELNKHLETLVQELVKVLRDITVIHFEN